MNALVVCAVQNIYFLSLSASGSLLPAELLQAVSDWYYGYSVVFKLCIL